MNCTIVFSTESVIGCTGDSDRPSTVAAAESTAAVKDADASFPFLMEALAAEILIIVVVLEEGIYMEIKSDNNKCNFAWLDVYSESTDGMYRTDKRIDKVDASKIQYQSPTIKLNQFRNPI